MPVDEEGNFYPMPSPGNPAQRHPYEPPPANSVAGLVNKERAGRVWDRLSSDHEEAQREAILDEAFGRQRQEEPERRRIVFEEPQPPPRVDRPLGPEAFKFISSAGADAPVPVAFNPSDGACHGGVDELRWRLEADALGTYGIEPTEVPAWVDNRVNRLITISAEMLQADPRRLERVRWSPGHPVQYLSDDELEPLPELPVLTCPGCGGEDIAVHDRDVPPDADCRRCNRHFTVRRRGDEYGRTVFEVPAPPDHSREIHMIGGPDAMTHIGNIG